MKISVSFLKSKFNEKTTIKKIENTSADFIHVDVMDGHFVFNKTYFKAKKLLLNTSKPLDVHMMVNKPEKYISTYKKLNTEYFTFHYEAVNDINKMINNIKKANMKVGIAINPTTEVGKIKEYLSKVDLVLVMTVFPGYGGQELIPEVIDKIEELNVFRNLNNCEYIISADGGINNNNIELLGKKGLDMAVSGSYICMNDDYNPYVESLR